MIDTTPFSIFARKPAPRPAVDAAPPDAAPIAEPLHEAPPPADESGAAEGDGHAEMTGALTEVGGVAAVGDAPSPSHPIAAAEEASEIPAARFHSDELAGFAAPADQIGLADPGVITLYVTLPDQSPARLASADTGLYQPVEHGDPVGEPQTGLAAGTLILTARGEVAVETLAAGDLALGLRGPALVPIRWVGRSSAAKPGVEIAAGALGPDRPRRPLRLAADHPVFVQPAAVPARSLVNGSTIQSVALEGAELFHVDVGAPEVLLAEGIPLSSDRRAPA